MTKPLAVVDEETYATHNINSLGKQCQRVLYWRWRDKDYLQKMHRKATVTTEEDNESFNSRVDQHRVAGRAALERGDVAVDILSVCDDAAAFLQCVAASDNRQSLDALQAKVESYNTGSS